MGRSAETEGHREICVCLFFLQDDWWQLREPEEAEEEASPTSLQGQRAGIVSSPTSPKI